MSRGIPADLYLVGHGDRTYDVESYSLELDYRVSGNHLQGVAEIVVRAREPLERVALDLAGMRVQKVLVDGHRAPRHVHRGQHLRVELDRTLTTGESARLQVRYSGRPQPVRSEWGEIGWEELADGVIVAAQPGGAPSWFPCNDRPDSKATYRFRITTDAAYTVVANGALRGSQRSGSRRTWVYEQREPMATYLATVQIGRYIHDEFAGPVPQHTYVPAALSVRCAQDLARQPRMLAVFTELFGPYPFEDYTVVVTPDELEIPVEAQGLSVFGANHLDGSSSHERLVAHELAHQWFGNSLTVAAWRDIWLHEGFACYAEWLWSEQSGGRSADQHARHHHAVLAAQPADLLLADPGPQRMFDDIVYKRGALTVHALRLTLGDVAFFAQLQDWVAAHRHGTVSTEMFEQHWSAQASLGPLLQQWLRRPELPALPARTTSAGATSARRSARWLRR